MSKPSYAGCATLLGMNRMALLLALSTTLACGGDRELTCEFLADESNCWARLAVATKNCLPAGPAVFEADRKSCTYSDGTRVVFEGAMPQQVEEIATTLGRLSFSIEKDGNTCAEFVDTFENRMEMTVGSETVVAQLRGDFSIICPGGEAYSSDFDRVFECAAEGIPAPTDGFDLKPDLFTWGVGSPGTGFELIRCESQ